MNISEHTSNFIQEMKRRNYSQNTINNYSSCINYFFSKSTKDHPKNINEKTNDNIIPLYRNNQLSNTTQKTAF